MRPDPSGLAHSLSPVDLPETAVPLPNGLAWTTTVIAVAGLVLAGLNAHALLGWANQLPPGAATARIAEKAEAWHGAVGAVGLNRPGEAMRAGWRSARELRFGVQPSSGAGASSPRKARANSSSATG
jgi:hypothetical protein